MKNYSVTKVASYIGYFVQAIILNFLPLTFVSLIENGISLDKIGLLITITFLVQIAVDLISIKIIKLLGLRGGVLIAHIMAAVGLIMLGILPSVMENTFLSLLISVTVYSVGGGLIEVVISPIIEYLPTRNKESQMSLLHSFYCWGQLLTVVITTVIFLCIGRENWKYAAFFWAVVPILNFFLFLNAPICEMENKKETKKSESITRRPLFYVLLCLMLCAGASELAVSQWSSTFLELGIGIDKATGDLLGPSVFALLMGIGRLLYSIMGYRLNINRAMLFCGSLCFICYITLFISRNPIISLIACAVTGFSVSIMWPGTISIAAARFEKGGALLFGLLAAFGDIGCSLGPWIFAVTSQKYGMHLGFLSGAVFPFTIVIFCLLFIRRRNAR